VARKEVNMVLLNFNEELMRVNRRSRAREESGILSSFIPQGRKYARHGIIACRPHGGVMFRSVRGRHDHDQQEHMEESVVERKEGNASWLVGCGFDVHLKQPNWVRQRGVPVTTWCGVAIRGATYFCVE